MADVKGLPYRQEESAREPIQKPGDPTRHKDMAEELAEELKGRAKTAKPTGLEMETGEVVQEIMRRRIEQIGIALEGLHNPPALIVDAVALMLGALVMARFGKDPASKTFGEVAGIMHDTALFAGGLMAGGVIGTGIALEKWGEAWYHATTYLLNASSNTRVGAFLGGGLGDSLYNALERPPSSSMRNRATRIMERGGSGIGY